MGKELSAENKIQAIGSLAVPLLTLSEFFTGAKNCKSKQENEETTNHPRTASHKDRRRLFVSSQKTGRKAPDEDRRRRLNRNYKTGGICRQEDPLI